MILIKKILFWISSLKVAIFLLFTIAIASSIGTAIPQGEASQIYIETYGDNPWLGLINGKTLLNLQLDHIYSSDWFLFLLLWLGLALIACSFRRQIPALRAAIKWKDYKQSKDLSKLLIAESIDIEGDKLLQTWRNLVSYLRDTGWRINPKVGRLSARKGVAGRFGPPLIHLGLVLLLIGAGLGSVKGQEVEKFLAPGRSFKLLDKQGENQLTLTLKNFNVERDPAGRTEQYYSLIDIYEPRTNSKQVAQISVNHPLRYKGLTVYQADWSLAAITLKIGASADLKLPLQSFPQLGDQIWGLVLPTNKDGGDPLLFSLSNEKGPVQIFNQNGMKVDSLMLGEEQKEVYGTYIQLKEILPASGLLIKRDPGVPIVYTGFLITLIGGCLSIISTSQLWVILDRNNNSIHIGGLNNRNLSSLANELPNIINAISSK